MASVALTLFARQGTWTHGQSGDYMYNDLLAILPHGLQITSLGAFTPEQVWLRTNYLFRYFSVLLFNHEHKRMITRSQQWNYGFQQNVNIHKRN